MLSMTSVNLRYRKIHKATKAAVVSTIRPLRQHRYTLFDLQYVFLFVLFSFCYYIMDKPIWLKLPIALFATGLLIPKRTRQFMLPFLAIAAWLILFYCCRFIPAEWRPHIFTSVLPALENILYGGNISELLATTPSAVKDLLAWMPYGVLHFVLPFVTAALIVFFGPPGTLPVFARTFGYMNLAGVLTQLFFPCAPPCKYIFLSFLSNFFFPGMNSALWFQKMDYDMSTCRHELDGKYWMDDETRRQSSHYAVMRHVYHVQIY